MPPEYDITCHVNPRHELYHLALPLTSLQTLVDHGHANVKFVSHPARAPVPFEDPLTLCMQVRTRRTGVQALVAIDVRDHSDYYAIRTLERADIYFKRSFHAADVLGLPSDLRKRVVPFGPNFACRSGVSTYAVLRKLVPQYVSHLARSPIQANERLRIWSNPLRQYLGSPAPRAFERHPAIPARPIVLFQTRVWTPRETGSDNADEINEERVAIVRALRRAFGRRFRGGLIPTAYARRCYPDAVTAERCSRVEYLALMRQGLVGVYTRGLHHSLAFKFPEYLAASMCVVSRTIRNDAPVPLVPGQHYLPFETPNECVAACARLLEDRVLAGRYRRAAWSYYESMIKPPAPLLQCLRYLSWTQQQPAALPAVAPGIALDNALRSTYAGVSPLSAQRCSIWPASSGDRPSTSRMNTSVEDADAGVAGH